MLLTLGLDHIVTFEVNTAVEKLGQFDDSFDVIFLDGDHNAEAVYREIPLALRKLTKNGRGLVVLHDYFPFLSPLWEGQEPLPGPYLAVERLFRESAEFHTVPLGELPWPTKLGSNVTSLAILSK